MMSDAVDVDLSHKKDAEKVLIDILCKVESYLYWCFPSHRMDIWSSQWSETSAQVLIDI